MRRLFVCAFLLSALAIPLGISAQEPTQITGVVRSAESRQPIEGASVRIQGASAGALTNAQGRYALAVPSGTRMLVVQMLGYATRQVEITGPVMDVFLEPTALELEGLVVTALGIQREARALGVAQQQVESQDLTRVDPNIVNTLSGKIAGVDITNSGPQGGSSRIVIRGANSLTGDNQPLFVVDGVPVDNYVGGRQDGFGVNGVLTDQGGIDYGNAIQDLDPDAIKSVTVLKGPNAAALYGSRAANGVVIVETKKGEGARGGYNIGVSQTVTFENELRLPAYQNAYGQGHAGRFAFYDGYDNGTFDGWDESWGPPLDVGLMIPQWNSPMVNGERQPLPWVSQPDNVNYFFRTGQTLVTNVSVAAATDRMNGRAGFTRMDMQGMVPGLTLRRNTFNFAGGIDATKRLSVNTSVQYVAADGENRPGTGYGEENPMSQFIWFGRNVDMRQLKALYDQVRPAGDPIEGLPYSWNTLFHPNPYFLQLKNRNNDTRDRLIGQISASFKFTDWLTGSLRTGTDWYQDYRLKSYAYNPQIDWAGFYTTNPVTGAREYLTTNGGFGQWDIGFQETNTDFLLNASPDLGLPVTTKFTFGGNRRDFHRNSDYTFVGQLAAPGIYDVSNAAGTPTRTDFLSQKRVNSLYGQAELGYHNYLFLTATGRNDWSSTLPVEHRSYFYPSVSGSFILTDAVPSLSGSAMSYAKLRASWARVGNDTDPYSLRNTFLADEIWNGTPSFTVPGQLANAKLKPETTESVEFGTELAFLDNRLGLDLTYYNEETRDQIMPVQLSRSTGFTSRLVNAGKVRNRGVEVLLRGTPVRTHDFRWQTTVTWAKNESKVLKLAEGVEGLELSLGNFWGVSLYAREGEPLGQLMGSAYQRDPNGNVIVSASGGYPLWTNAPQVLGNVNPDWRAGWANEVSYKNFRLHFLFDVRQGGKIFSVTNLFGRYAGVLQETVAGRCTPAADLGPGESPPQGYPVCDANTGIVYKGVNRVVNGSDTTYVKNETVIDAETFWSYQYNVREAHMEDASYVKFREATLTFDVPTGFTDRLGLSGLQVSLVGRNLYLWSKAKHIDPETSMEGTNVQGFEYGQMPSARSFGFTVSVRP